MKDKDFVLELGELLLQSVNSEKEEIKIKRNQ